MNYNKYGQKNYNYNPESQNNFQSHPKNYQRGPPQKKVHGNQYYQE